MLRPVGTTPGIAVGAVSRPRRDEAAAKRGQQVVDFLGCLGKTVAELPRPAEVVRELCGSGAAATLPPTARSASSADQPSTSEMPQKLFAFLPQVFLRGSPAAPAAAGGTGHDLGLAVEETGPQAGHQPGNNELFRRRLAQHVQVDVDVVSLWISSKVALHPLDLFGREQWPGFPGAIADADRDRDGHRVPRRLIVRAEFLLQAAVLQARPTFPGRCADSTGRRPAPRRPRAARGGRSERHRPGGGRRTTRPGCRRSRD